MWWVLCCVACGRGDVRHFEPKKCFQCVLCRSGNESQASAAVSQNCSGRPYCPVRAETGCNLLRHTATQNDHERANRAALSALVHVIMERFSYAIRNTMDVTTALSQFSWNMCYTVHMCVCICTVRALHIL